jgi:hypothetical protein
MLASSGRMCSLRSRPLRTPAPGSLRDARTSETNKPGTHTHVELG